MDLDNFIDNWNLNFMDFPIDLLNLDRMEPRNLGYNYTFKIFLKKIFF